MARFFVDGENIVRIKVYLPHNAEDPINFGEPVWFYIDPDDEEVYDSGKGTIFGYLLNRSMYWPSYPLYTKMPIIANGVEKSYVPYKWLEVNARHGMHDYNKEYDVFILEILEHLRNNIPIPEYKYRILLRILAKYANGSYDLLHSAFTDLISYIHVRMENNTVNFDIGACYGMCELCNEIRIDKLPPQP